MTRDVSARRCNLCCVYFRNVCMVVAGVCGWAVSYSSCGRQETACNQLLVFILRLAWGSQHSCQGNRQFFLGLAVGVRLIFLLHTLFSLVRQINGCWVLIIGSRQLIIQPYALRLLFVVNYAYLRLRNSSIWQFLPICSRLVLTVRQSLQDCWRLRPSSYMRFSSIMNPYLSNSTSAVGLQFTLWDSLTYNWC